MVTEAAPLPSAAAAPQFPWLPSPQSSPTSPSWPYAASGASPRPPLRKRLPGSAWGRTVSSSAFPPEPSSWPPATLTGTAVQKAETGPGAELHSVVPSKIAMGGGRKRGPVSLSMGCCPLLFGPLPGNGALPGPLASSHAGDTLLKEKVSEAPCFLRPSPVSGGFPGAPKALLGKAALVLPPDRPQSLSAPKLSCGKQAQRWPLGTISLKCSH